MIPRRHLHEGMDFANSTHIDRRRDPSGGLSVGDNQLSFAARTYYGDYAALNQDERAVRIRIEDTDMDIPADVLPHIFEFL